VSVKRMHTGEVPTDEALVRRLLTSQFPKWAELPLKPVRSAGTDNAIYRLGDDMSVRLPRIDWATGQIDKEFTWLPRLAPQLPLAIPEPLARGEAGAGYPYDWAVYKWLEGSNATLKQIKDPARAATELAQFLKALQEIDTEGGLAAAEHNIRGLPLANRDAGTRKAIAELKNLIDIDTALNVWESALDAPQWDRPPVWFHGDMLVGNILFTRGELSAVIDFGGLAVGDPACDLMIAWSLFEGESRAAFRAALDVDDATWARARGHALSQAVIFIPYYLETNPVGVANAQHMLSAVFADFETDG